MDHEKIIYGIIGNPVKHSLSPVMHNTAFRALEVDAEYRIFGLEELEVEPFLEDLRDPTSPVFGLNVTVPYKETVLPYLDSLAPLAEKIKAVNTILVTPQRKLIGYNTDAPGFIAHLTELKVETKDKTIAVLGAGGSSRAIIAALCLLPERPRVIKIYNRTADRVVKLIEGLKERMDTSLIETVMSVEELDLRAADVLINTTSIGLHADDPWLVPEEDLHQDLFVYDLIYNPKETILLRMAREQGARTSNGLGMLFFQGVLALQHWADTQMEEDVKKKMRIALEEAADNL